MPVVPSLLRAARVAANLSRTEAGAQLGKSYPAMEAYERGAVVPPGNVLVAMARLYGVAVEELCRDIDPAGAA
jgi:transcriptional regulator with XRE-family HTH domain